MDFSLFSSKSFIISATVIIVLLVLKFSKTAKHVWLVWWLEVALQRLITFLIEPSRLQLLKDLKSERSSDPERRKQGQIKILEIGVGRGRNLKYYPSGTKMICVDPNRHFKKALLENLKNHPNVEVERFLYTGAEDIDDIPDESVDLIVSTHVLCFVEDLEKALQHLKRVLVKGGKYYYLEHCAAPNKCILLTQNLLQPLWKIIASGCHLTKDIETGILSTGFSKVSQKTSKISLVPFPFQYHTIGVATK